MIPDVVRKSRDHDAKSDKGKAVRHFRKMSNDRRPLLGKSIIVSPLLMMTALLMSCASRVASVGVDGGDDREHVRCGRSGLEMAPTCNKCPDSEASCTSEKCSWMKHTSLCRDRFSPTTRTASVHLVYDRPFRVNNPAWWFQKLIVVGTSDATSFTTNGQNFGFGGVEQTSKDPTRGRVIFKIWGGCDDGHGAGCGDANGEASDQPKLLACGTGVTCRKGEEGERKAQQESFFDTDMLPSLDSPYHFVTWADPKNDDNTAVYSGFFYAECLKRWRFLSSIEISTGNKNWWHGGMISTVEQFAPIDTFDGRAGLFGPSFMSDLTNDGTGSSFHQIPSAYFSFGMLENHEHINAWSQNGAIGIETGGEAQQTVSKWTRFDYPSTKRSPELLQFAKFIPCLNSAKHNVDDIEACLSESSDLL